MPEIDPATSLMRYVASALLCLSAVAAHGQYGTVTGQIFCSDTQKPARFASVSLAPDFGSTGNGGGNSYRNGGGGTTAVTAPDGTFTLKNISPGNYDIQVTMPGYVQPLRLLNLLANSDPTTLQPWLSMLTRITVQPGQATNAMTTIYRGADVAGTVAYDDGSPAAGLTVQALFALPVTGAAPSSASMTAATANLRYSGVTSVTDDHGKFHLSGLADGTYALQTNPRGGGNIFPVYLGNTINRTQAELISVKAGSERSDIEIQIDITNLHQVRGVLVSADNRAVSDTGVTLSLSAGGGDSLHTSTGIDGSFTFADVPDGKFTVSAGTSTQITVNGSDITDVNLTAAH